MKFIDRTEELLRLDRLARRSQGGLAVVYGRRRIGKTRLLLEWAAKHDGLYTVADQSTSGIQRRYVAEAVAQRLPGFADAEFPDWRSLLARLAREARFVGWRGPFIIDELPYLVLSSPELPSVLQRWVDHEAKQARLVVALAGSSQRMMQGLVLAGDSPIFGRAREILEIGPMDPRHLSQVFRSMSVSGLVETYAAWGGVPRYWELASAERGSCPHRIDRLVLDPLGPLHREPDRLLIEEIPAAVEVRPVLDAIGAGAHRVSEIAGRIGRPATSLSRPLERLQDMRLVRREVPFGEAERKTRRTLYRIEDPFFRMWFRVVAPHRGQLASSPGNARARLLDRYWNELVAGAWEELCRLELPRVPPSSRLGRLGPWTAARRWWRGGLPEWDLVSESIDGRRLLLGEAKWTRRPMSRAALGREAERLAGKALPALPGRFASHEVQRVLFVPDLVRGLPRTLSGVLVATCKDLLR